MWAPEEFAYTEEEAALIKNLIDEGWHSTSNKYRTIARIRLLDVLPKEKVDDWRTFVKEEFIPWIEASGLSHQFTFWQRHMLRCGREPFVEHRELSLSQFHAFKKLGGPMA